ncbi:hypothetical protein DFJ73DRAFT_760901 [Zopfochytrium polystomum]|nr:hypothetical protein DFJ73DRAFT_760901 [Zopfochytrium polystomum]
MDPHSSASVLSQLQHQIGDLHTDDVNGHSSAPIDGFTETGGSSSSTVSADVDDDDSAESIASASVAVSKKPAAAPDLKSMEQFPSLPTAPNRPLPAWRVPPVSSPKPAAAAPKKPAGTVTERVDIPLNLHAKLPANGRGSAGDLFKLITIKTQTSIESSVNRHDGVTTYLISGKADQVKQARRELISKVGIEVKLTVNMPVSVRPHLFGSGGKNLKDLTARTGCKIDVPKLKEPVNASADYEPDLDEEEQEITITGDFEGAKIAKEEIESLITKRTSKVTLRVPVPRQYHPHIAGAHGTNVEALQLETNTRIHIPPMGPITGAKADRNLDEISIVGSKEAVRAVEEKVKSHLEELQRALQNATVTIKKKQQRFLIGPKGAAMQEILQESGCSVEVPAADDPSEEVRILGPASKLSAALGIIFQKANAITLEEVDIAPLLPKSTDVALFLRFLFSKERTEVRKIETDNSVSLHKLATDDNPSNLVEVQGKESEGVKNGRTALIALVKELGSTLYIGEIEIPHELHKFVVGKGGQNIGKLKATPSFEGRLVDLIVPDQDREKDSIVVVVKRVSAGLGAAPNAKAPKKGPSPADASLTEAQAFVAKLREDILAIVTAQADFVSETVPVPSKYHGRLIGSGGDKLKELLGPHANDVSVRFPTAASKEKDEAAPKKAAAIEPNTIVIKGPKKLVAEVKAKLTAVAAELKHIEVIASYSESLSIKKGLGKRVLSGAGGGNGGAPEDRGPGGIGWLIRQVKEAMAAAPVAHAKAGEAPPPEAAINSLRVDIETPSSVTAETETLVITGPKVCVQHAKKILAERSTRLADLTQVEVKLFEEISAAAKTELKASADEAELKRLTIRRLIGKEGKGVKAIMERYAVFVQFPEGKRRRRKAGEDDEETEDAVVDEDVAAATNVDGMAVIKGNKNDVEDARKAILEAIEKEIIRSFSLSFVIPKSVLPFIVGAQGSKIKAIKDASDCRIDFNDVEDADGNPAIEVVIEGSRKGCQAAKKKILDEADELAKSVAIPIPNYLHKDIIGPAGTRIRTLIDAFGGQDKVKVQFPSRGDSVIGGPGSNVVTIKAHRRDLDKLRTAILDATADVLSTPEMKHALIDEETAEVVADTVTVSKSDVSRILGRGGDSVKEIMRTHKVVLWVAEADEGSEKSAEVEIRVVGTTTESVEAALVDVKGKLQSVKSVPVPAKILEILAESGQRRSTELAAVQDIAKRIRAESGGSAHVDIPDAVSKGKPDATLEIRGESKAVEAAVATVTRLLGELALYDANISIPIAGELRPHIIGKAGATISRLRADVVIRGSQEAVDAAAALVNKIVADQKVRLEQEKARRASPAAFSAGPTSTSKSLPLGPARIDDDNSSDATGDSGHVPTPAAATGVPGFSGRSAQRGGKRRGGAPAETSIPRPIASAPPAAALSYQAYTSTLEKPSEDVWQDVKKKGKKTEEEAVPAAVEAKQVPGAPSSSSSASVSVTVTAPADAAVPGAAGAGEAAKKKKKKKSAGATNIDTSVQQQQQPPAAAAASSLLVPAVHVSGPASPSPTSTHFSLPHARQRRHRPPSRPRHSRRPILRTTRTFGAATAPPKATEDDGWTTVKKFKMNKVEAAAAAAAAAAAPAAAEGGEGAAAKKKKKKNKKKKAGAAADGGAGGEGSGGDD